MVPLCICCFSVGSRIGWILASDSSTSVSSDFVPALQWGCSNSTTGERSSYNTGLIYLCWGICLSVCLSYNYCKALYVEFRTLHCSEFEGISVAYHASRTVFHQITKAIRQKNIIVCKTQWSELENSSDNGCSMKITTLISEAYNCLCLDWFHHICSRDFPSGGKHKKPYFCADFLNF